MLHRNVGGIDRAARLVLGPVLLLAGLIFLGAGHSLHWPAIVLGLAGLVSGATGFCVLYVPFGISTRRP